MAGTDRQDGRVLHLALGEEGVFRRSAADVDEEDGKLAVYVQLPTIQ